MSLTKLTKPPYKDPQGRWYTQALFWEPLQDKAEHLWRIEPIFTLYADRPGLISARKTFVAMEDPTGRKWALTYLGDWEHWLRLMKAQWFRDAYEVWIAELNEHLKSKAISKILEIMGSENGAQSLAAAKFIAQEEYNTKKRGRPTKQELQGELKRAVQQLEVEDEDLERIGLKVIQGGKSG